MKVQDIKKTQHLMHESENVVITSHKNPDGDAVGSSLALYHYLVKMGKSVSVILPNAFPDFLNWLPGVEGVKLYSDNKQECDEVLNNADVMFSLDYNALHRTGDLASALESSSCPFIMIDHHQQPDDFASVMYSDTSMCSTCQMVYHFIESLNGVNQIDVDIATCIYTGIMTDTGSFRFRSTTSLTHRVISNLIDIGVDNALVHQMVYDNNSYNRLQLLGKALNNLKVLKQYHTAYITLSAEDLKRFNAQKGDTEGVVNYALSLKGVKLAAIFKEDIDQGIVKMSFRSKGNFSVNLLAREHFNGGGHTNAAGGISELSLDKVLDKFISILPLYKQELTSV